MTVLRVGLLGVVCVLSAGCPSGDDATDDYPITPGGGGNSTTSGAGGDGDGGDGGVDGPTVDASTMIMARVCYLADHRNIYDNNQCATSGAEGLTVELDGNQAITMSNGAFTIAVPTDPMARWHISGKQILPTVIPYDTNRSLPVVTRDTYENDAGNVGLTLPTAGSAAVVVRVYRANMALVGATVISDHQSVNEVYDGNMATPKWELDSTGPRGIAWMSQNNVADGAVTLTITDSAGATATATLPVEDLSITFARIDL